MTCVLLLAIATQYWQCDGRVNTMDVTCDVLGGKLEYFQV